MMMSLTAPSLGRPSLHYGLMAANALVYSGVYLMINPSGLPLVPTLLLMRVGLFFLVTYLVDRLMRQASQTARGRVGELVGARDAERRRIAGEIHDWLGSGLVAPMRRLELALRAPDPAAARERVGEAVAVLRQGHDELRRIMEALHPHLLEQLGLAEALRAYCLGWREASVTFSATAGPEPTPAAALALYRIVQEALTNAARHGRAGRVQVALALDADPIRLTVQDDGVGFGEPRAGGRGLAGMRERVEALGGWVEVTSRPGRGTRVVAAVPHNSLEQK